ncbi:MAG: FecCD family ABC transporter permease [Trebonia sp.]
MRKRTALGAAAASLVVAAVVASFVGAADLNPLATAAALLDRAAPFLHLPTSLGSLDKAVLFQIRLPRVVLGALVGGLLALAGAGYQGVFRNPLVDSGMLGASAGAGLGATLAIVYLDGAGQGAGPLAVPLAAFVGSLAGVAAAYATGAAASRHTALSDGVATLLLAGIAVGSFFTAVQTFVLQRSSSDIGVVYSWLLGSLSAASWSQVTTILPYAAVSSVVILLHGRHLDVLAVGDEEARALGLSPGRTRALVVAASALAAASAVAVSGLIGFVGIVIPHVARRIAGPSYTSVLPLSLLSGAGFLVLADTLARTVLSPAELPIGVVTALVGAPAFVWVLRGTRHVGT